MKNAKIYWDENSQIADLKIGRYVDQVLERMAEYHTAEKRDKAIGMNDGEERIKLSWAREFSLMTPEMVVRGAKKIRDQNFCPNLAKFTQLCKPSAEEAYVEAQIGMQARSRGEFGAWTCPAVYFSAIEFGGSDLREKVWLAANARFSKIYERVIERQERGELDVIPAPAAVEHRIENTPLRRDTVKVEELVCRAQAAVKVKAGMWWAHSPKSLTATREMLYRAKGGLVDMDTVAQNLKIGTIEADGDWYKSIGYIERGNLVLV